MPHAEADTRAKLIDPALHTRDWTEEFLRREETVGVLAISVGSKETCHQMAGGTL